MLLTEEGYIETSGSTYTHHYYLKDHIGNHRIVMNSAGTVVQATNYYPSGTTMADYPRATTQGVQPYKFGGKELDRKDNLNFYDCEARSYDPTLMRFTSTDLMMEKYYAWSPYAYCANNPLRYIDPTGMSWKPTYDEDHEGNRTYNGYEWIPEEESYNDDGTLKTGLYAQAIFFSDNGTFDAGNDNNIGSSAATVYLADGTTTIFNANTNPSSSDYATVPFRIYHATVGKHKGDYIALKMRDEGATSQTIELGGANPAHPNRTYAEGINIHKPGLNNTTGMTRSGSPISAGCLLIDRNNWDNFIGIFDTETQRANTVSVTVSRSMATPANVNRLPAFNFIMSGTRHSFFSSLKR
jgi:RHS repeat-associated protein